MPLDDLPDWLPAWCVDQLGDEPVSVLFELRQISAVFGLRLAGGRDVVVKARADDGRAGRRLRIATGVALDRNHGIGPETASIVPGVQDIPERNLMIDNG